MHYFLTSYKFDDEPVEQRFLASLQVLGIHLLGKDYADTWKYNGNL